MQHAGLVELSAAQVRHLVIEATEGAGGENPFPPQAGMPQVGSPGGVAGPAPIIVWWNFNAEAAPGIDRLPLTRAERTELQALGVTLPDPGARVLGELLHKIMNQLFAGPARKPDVAAAEAGAIFDREGPRLVAALFLPGTDAQREHIRRVTTRTAHTLYSLMAEGRLRVLSTEQEQTGEALNTSFAGRVDLVLGDPPRILEEIEGAREQYMPRMSFESPQTMYEPSRTQPCAFFDELRSAK